MNRSFWLAVYRNWNRLGVLVMLVAVAALWRFIAGLVALIRKSYLFKAPLAASQQVEFSEAGQLSLSVEGPRFSTRFAGVGFELQAMDGRRIEGRRVLFRLQTSGLSTARLEVLRYDIPWPGRYVFNMTGLGAPREGDARHAVVFMRPRTGRTVAYILGIVLASMVFIASLVFFLMRLVL